MSVARSCEQTELAIRHTWSGQALPSEEHAWLRVRRDHLDLCLRWDVPFYRDPPPAGASGRYEGLWNHEVVECFLAVPETGQYLELEFGPHGHWLALEFESYRQRRGNLDVRDFIWQCTAQRWYGSAAIALSPLVSSVKTGNAYLIHGAPNRRCHHAAHGHPRLSP